MMTRLVILLLGITFINCKTHKQIAFTESTAATSTNLNATFTDLKLLEARYENRTSGIRGGATGREYFFKVLVLTSDKLTFDSAWMKNYGYDIFIANESTVVSNSAIQFSKNDTIILRISDVSGKPIKKNSAAPIEYDGSALVRYNTRSKTSYLVVKEITERVLPNMQ